MAAILSQTNKVNRAVRYYGLEESRLRFKRFRKKAGNALLLAFVFLPISPFFSVLFFMFFIIKFSVELYGTFFKNEYYIRQYNAVFQPQTAEKVVSVIGYRVYDEELDAHLSIIKAGNLDSLAQKQRIMEKPGNKARHIGLDMKLAKTHIVLVGKTGAGKTECLRSIMDDIMKNGGGIFFNDGKSDIKMLNEVFLQAKENYRETSVRVLNFLKAEKAAESNTFNFFTNQHPVKLVEFLANLAFKESGGEGNAAYFQNRGKALLLPVATALYVRNNLLGEGLDSEKLRDNMEVINVSIIFIVFYCMCRDLDDIIAANTNIKKMLDLSTGTTFAKTSYFDNIAKLLQMIVDDPTKRVPIEKELNIKCSFLKDCYTSVLVTLRGYLSNVWNRYAPLLECVALCVYYYAKTEKPQKQFYSLNANSKQLFSLYEIKTMYNVVKEAFTPIQDNKAYKLDENNELVKKTLDAKIWDADLYGKGAVTKKVFISALEEAFNPQQNSIEKPPADAIQQHAYAQQQWEQLFNVFTAYKHILAQPKSEIDPIQVVADNQILYTLLPPLELSKAQIEILGKIVIMTIKNFAGIALGGEYIGIHETIKNIAKDRYTPKPFTLINLDEYGAYPVGDIDTILAQVRSLNMSVVLGIQDFVSLKTSGSDETAQKRALANTTKIIFKVADKDVIEWLETMVSEQEVEKSEYKRDAAGELVLDVTTRLEKEKLVPIRKVEDADNGFCLMMLGGEQDRAIWCHTFFRGGKSGNIKLIHTSSINGLRHSSEQNIEKDYETFKDILKAS